MKAHLGRLDTLIGGIALTDTGHIVDRLGTSHITVLHNGVVIVLRHSQLEHIGRHLAPSVGIAAVALGQSHGIADMEATAIVTGKDEVGTLVVVVDVGERTVKFGNQFGGSSNVHLRLEQAAARHTQMIA